MQPVHVQDEFAPLKVALVHDGTNAVTLSMEEQRRLIPAEELRDHPEAGPVFRDRIVEQQAEFLKLLAFHGVTLLYPETQPGAFCQVFTRDPCFAVGDTLYLGSLRDAYRHPEVAGLVSIGQRVSKVASLWGGGARIEGGDVMVLQGGRLVLVGMNRHTNEAGFQNLSGHLAAIGANVVRVPHRPCTWTAAWPRCRGAGHWWLRTICRRRCFLCSAPISATSCRWTAGRRPFTWRRTFFGWTRPRPCRRRPRGGQTNCCAPWVTRSMSWISRR
jgi:hypothetical protein